MIPRRTFFKGVALTFLSGLAVKPVLGQTVPGTDPVTGMTEMNLGNDRLFYLTKMSFESVVNTTFRFKVGDEYVDMTLVRVIDNLAGDQRTDGREWFSLDFQGSTTAVLPQDVYSITHPQLGRFSLLVVPVGNDEHGPYLQAVINRMYGPASVAVRKGRKDAAN